MNSAAIRSHKFRTMYYVHTAIMLLIMACACWVPPFGHITRLGAQTIMIFLAVAYGWCFISLGWPSVLGVIVFGLLGYKPMNGVLSSAFGNPTMIQVFLLLTIVAFITVSGLADYIARWMLSRKIGRKSPYIFVFLILLSAYVLALICNGSPAQLVVYSIVIGILLEAGYTKEDRLPTILLLGVAVAAILGAAVPPYTVVGIGMTKGYTLVTGHEINLLSYFCVNNILFLPFLIVLVLLMKYVFRCELVKLKAKIHKVAEDNAALKMTQEQKIGLITLFLFLLCIFLPGILPKLPFHVPGTELIRKLGVNSLCMLLLILGMIVQVAAKGGVKCAIDVHKCLAKVPWDLLVMQGFCCELALLVTNDSTGIFNSIVALLQPLAQGLGKFAFLMLISAFILALTQISHNVILANVMPPIILPMGMACGIEPHIMLSCMLLPVAMGIVLPSGSACAAIYYGISDWVDTKRGFIASAVVFVIGVMYNCLSALVFSALF